MEIGKELRTLPLSDQVRNWLLNLADDDDSSGIESVVHVMHCAVEKRDEFIALTVDGRYIGAERFHNKAAVEEAFGGGSPLQLPTALLSYQPSDDVYLVCKKVVRNLVIEETLKMDQEPDIKNCMEE